MALQAHTHTLTYHNSIDLIVRLLFLAHVLLELCGMHAEFGPPPAPRDRAHRSRRMTSHSGAAAGFRVGC